MPSDLFCDQDGRTAQPNPTPCEWSFERPRVDDFQERGILDWVFGSSKKPQPIPGADEIALPGLSVGESADAKDHVIVKKNGPVHIAYYKAQESSVRLDSGGSGFFISADGLIATASHVVPVGASKLVADTVDGNMYVAEMISRDVVLLKVAASDRQKTFPYLKLNTKDAFGEELAVTGHPKGWPSVYISMGAALEQPYKSNNKTWINANDLMRMKAHTEGGNSGGAVIDFNGDVRGVLVGGGGTTISLVVPSKNVDKLVKWTERAENQKIDHELGYNMASYERAANAKEPPAPLVFAKQPPKEQPPKEQPKEQAPKDLPVQSKELPMWIKSPGAGSYASPYGKIQHNKMNYYEQKKILDERKPSPGGVELDPDLD